MWKGGRSISQNHLSSGRWLIICKGAAMRIFDCGNLWIEWRLTAMWGDDSTLCLFLSVLGSARLILSLCLVSPGQFPAVINPAPSTWKSKPLQKWNTIREGGQKKSLISPFLIHANNATQQPTKSWETERQHAPCCCEGGWMDGPGGTGAMCSCVTHETFHLHLLYVCRPWEWGLTLASQNPAAWYWPPLFF